MDPTLLKKIKKNRKRYRNKRTHSEIVEKVKVKQEINGDGEGCNLSRSFEVRGD